MKRYLILFFLLFVGVAVCHAAGEKEENNKILQEVSLMKHDSLRLQKLNELVNQAVNEPKTYVLYLNKLLQEAKLQNNKKYIAKSYLLYLYSGYNEHDSKKVNLWMSKLEPLARKEGYYDYLFDAQQCIIDMLVLSQEFELAEQKSEQMLADAQKLNITDGIVAAHKSLASVYRSTYRFKEAAETLETAYKLSAKMKNVQSKLELITYLMSVYKYTGDHPNWLKYLAIKENEINKLIAKEPGQAEYYKGDLMLTYLSYLGYYIETNQKKKAEHYKQLVEKYMCSEYAVYQLNYFKGMADYYQFAGQWDKALEFRSKQCEVIKPLSYRDYPYMLSDKAAILYRMGREKEALETAKEVLRVKDTVRVSIFSKQIEQLKSSYISNQELLEQARIRRYFQYSILGVVLLFIIIFSYFAYKYYFIKKNLTQSEKEIRRIAENVQKATQAKERFLSNMSYAIRIPLNEVVNRSLLLASKQQIGEEKRTKVAQAILDTSSDLMSLVEEILDLSRLEAGRMKFSISEIEVNSLVRDLAGIFPALDLEIISPFPESQNILVEIDGVRLKQVFSSLLSDTVKGKKVFIKLEKTSDTVLSIQITHTNLASLNPAQNIIIRNEINRMIIEHFGGEYKVVPEAVCFTLRIQNTKLASDTR